MADFLLRVLDYINDAFGSGPGKTIQVDMQAQMKGTEERALLHSILQRVEGIAVSYISTMKIYRL